MKRLLLTALLGLTCAQQMCANDTFNALQIAGTQLISAKAKFDSDLLAQATLPVATGCALGALATVTSATYRHIRYYKYKAEGNTNPLFINTIIHGGVMSDPIPNFNYGKSIKNRFDFSSKLAGNRLGKNLAHGIVWGGVLGIIYNFCKNRCTAESGIVGLGTVITGFICASLTGQCLMDTGGKNQRTLFSKTKLPA